MRKVNGKRVAPASAVDGNFSPESIAQQFADKYQNLYNSVSFNECEMN